MLTETLYKRTLVKNVIASKKRKFCSLMSPFVILKKKMSCHTNEIFRKKLLRAYE